VGAINDVHARLVVLRRRSWVKSKLLSPAAAAMHFVPALASARQATPNVTTLASPNSGKAAGQPNRDLVARGEGAYPGNSPTAPRSPHGRNKSAWRAQYGDVSATQTI
jgi:hypothetical protein